MLNFEKNREPFKGETDRIYSSYEKTIAIPSCRKEITEKPSAVRS